LTRPDQAAASIGIQSPLRERLRALAVLFLKLGAISFGGPAAAIGLMQDEVVRKRQWVTQQQYLDMLGLTNLIPGPNSTEICDQRGFRARGMGGAGGRGRELYCPSGADHGGGGMGLRSFRYVAPGGVAAGWSEAGARRTLDEKSTAPSAVRLAIRK